MRLIRRFSLVASAVALCTTTGTALAQNDLCVNAIPVAIPSATSGTTVGATIEAPAPPTCVTSYSAPGVWYTLVGNGNTLVVDLCTGGSYDSKLHVYCNSGGSPCAGGFACVTGNDDTSGCGTGASSRVTFCSALGQTYHVLVSGFSAATGAFTLTVTDGAACATAVTCVPPILGACCSTTGTCTSTTSAACTGTSLFQGNNTVCTPTNPCTALLGACCSTTGVCTLRTTPGCTGTSLFSGVGTVCDPSPCLNVGSCCVTATGACSITAASGCTATGRVFTLGNVTCTPNPCPQPISGACCNVTCCTVVLQTACVLPAVFQGANSTCTPGLCGVGEPNDDCVGLGPTFTFAGTGFTATGSNLLACTTGLSTCGAGGAFDVFYAFTPSIAGPFTANLCGSSTNWDSVLSVHTACPPSSANQVVGFCNDDNCTGQIGTSAITVPVVLTAGQTYFVRVAGYINANFGPNRATFVLSVDSGALGACCQTSGACLIGTQNVCTGTWTASVTCSPNPCPQPAGSCCAANGNCTEVLGAAACPTGTFTIGGVCTPNTCTQPSGSCCQTDGSCAEVLGAGACVGGTFTIAAVCTPNPCPQPLVNDTCATATTVTVGTPAATGSNATALTSLDEDASCTTSSKGVWFDFTAPAAGLYQFDTEGSAQADTVLEIFTACGGTSLDCDDDSGTVNLSLIQLTLAANQNVKVLLASFGGTATGGGFNFNISQIASGSCCAANGNCTETSLAACLTPSVWTSGGVCTPNTCTQPSGSCCVADGSCTEVLGAGACVGTFTVGGVCTPNICPPPTGACCIATCCTTTTQAACTGTWTVAVLCSANPCGSPANDLCTNAIAVTAGTAFLGSTCSATNTDDGPAGTGGDCDVSNLSVWHTFTPAHTAAYRVETCGSAFDTELAIFTTDCTTFTQVACNDDSGSSGGLPTCGLQSLVPSVVLTAGTTYHIRVGAFGTTTSGAYSLLVSAVDALGACCDGGTCTQTDAANCAFVFTAGNVCTPNSCAPATGACCCGSNCVVTTPAACVTGPGTNAAFTAGGVCVPFSLTVPCCRGDYNKSGGAPSVQDIFDFLSGYFSGSNCADTNDTGGINTVQDIFDFLSAYFGGC